MRFRLILSAAVATLLLLGSACSKGSDGDSNFTDSSNDGGGSNDGSGSSGDGSGPPKLTSLKPGKAGSPGTISRKADGLWYEGGKNSPFTGTIVHKEDDTTWEEKYSNGIRSAVRAWDKDGDRVELHSWNIDGSPKN